MGRFGRDELSIQHGIDGDEKVTLGEPYDQYFRYENPTWLHRRNTSSAIEGWVREGTAGARIRLQRESRRSWWVRDVRRIGFTLQSVVTAEMDFLDLRLWENAGTAELTGFVEWDAPSGNVHSNLHFDLTAGMVYTREREGTRLEKSYDNEPFGRAAAALVAKRAIGGFNLGTRLYAAAYLAESKPVLQRAINLNGADPYETLGNPFVRSRGALLVRPGFFYHSPGGGNLRGYDVGLGGRWIGSLNLEIERGVIEKRSGILRGASLVAFLDAAVVDTLAVPATGFDNVVTALYDAGAGLRLRLQVEDLEFPLRVEFPLLVSRPPFARDADAGDDKFEFRWLVSLQLTF